MHHFFAYMARMRFIDRWALMRNSYTENIQEHSHMVAVLAHALAVLRNEYFGGQVDTGAVAVAALYHDASEILTGDMPTPIKYYNPDIRDAYKQVEAIACRKLTGMLPQRLQDIYADLLTPADVSAAPNVPLMFGRGLQADPSLLRQAMGGPAASLEELREFHDRLYGLYCRDFSGDVPVLHHMRELWNYFSRSFRETDTLLRQVRKAGDCRAYETAVRQFFYDAELSH